jgi:EPS-associated MarR family transcriptional regulator
MKAKPCVHSVNIFEITMSITENTNLEKEEVLKVLREIKSNPEMTQRELSIKLGISLGKVNFLMKALIHQGLIKVHNFKNSNNKNAYLYYLTPNGVEVKARTTYFFLKRKMQEYEQLEEEIRLLKKEASEGASHSYPAE